MVPTIRGRLRPRAMLACALVVASLAGSSLVTFAASTSPSCAVVASVEKLQGAGRLDEARRVLDDRLKELREDEEAGTSGDDELIACLALLERLDLAIAQQAIDALEFATPYLLPEDRREPLTKMAEATSEALGRLRPSNAPVVAVIQKGGRTIGASTNVPDDGRVVRAVAGWAGEELLPAVTVLFQAALFFGVLVAAAAGFRGWRRKRTRPGLAIRIIDHTAGGDPTESVTIAEQLTMELRAIGRESHIGTEVAGLIDRSFGGSTLEAVSELKDMFDDTPITVGVVSFSARRVFAGLGRLFERPYATTLVGVLTKLGDLTTLALKGGDTEPAIDEFVSAPGDNAREQIVRDVAARIAVALVPNDQLFTKSPQSLRASLEAEAILGAIDVRARSAIPRAKSQDADPRGDVQDSLIAAQNVLKVALRYDPRNWRARFRLGSVLRRRRQHEEAADQFDFLAAAVRSSPPMSFPKGFAWTVKYHWAVALAESIEPATHRGVVTAGKKKYERARELLNELEPGAGTDGQKILIRSARVAANLAELEDRRARRAYREPWSRSQEPTTEEKDLCAELEAEEQHLWELVQSSPGTDLDYDLTLAAAHAAAQNAAGRALALVGNSHRAYKLLRWAKGTHVLPDGFADPLVNFASLLMGEKEKLALSWQEDAESALRDALRISAEFPRAHHLYGRLLAATGRAEEAETHFLAAPDHPWTAFLRAKLKRQKKEYLAALDLIRRSIAFDDRVDERHVEFGEIVLEAAAADAKDSSSGGARVEALGYAKTAAESAPDEIAPTIQDQARALVTRLEAPIRPAAA